MKLEDKVVIQLGNLSDYGGACASEGIVIHNDETFGCIAVTRDNDGILVALNVTKEKRNFPEAECYSTSGLQLNQLNGYLDLKLSLLLRTKIDELSEKIESLKVLNHKDKE